MKRFEEKVKDIVDVRSLSHLDDFAADPAMTLAGYHFTDITSDLMAKWVGRIAGVKSGQGVASALAGFRGVGKSHFLAAVGAIVASPEFRSKVTDEHVATHAAQLSRRHYPVAYVHRGSGETLLDELKAAVATLIGADPTTLGDSIGELLPVAASAGGEVPLVLLVDTAAGRESRVARDDGMVLSQIAEAAKAMGIFVGLALDDDISGADGLNSSISSSFTIDYLDQEHLYKIVDTHIFTKQERNRALLHTIYDEYREALPGFRWSEQRFTSLYPLHPATLEIAPLIRLYIQDFALLGFASEAGVRILGRPANSLIGIDEIFDNVEKRLRQVADLKETFESFDRVDQEVVAKTAVNTRLTAKLILKGLFLLSLDGQGATAQDVAAAMLILENGTTINVDDLLASFATALPAVMERTDDGKEPKYLFKIDGKEDINGVLAEQAVNVPDDVLWNVLLRHTAEEFSDMEAPGESGITGCNVEWRGGIRRGQIVWDAEKLPDATANTGQLDWAVAASADGSLNAPESGYPILHWKLGSLNQEEKKTIGRFYVLQTDHDLREQFKDTVATAMQIHSIAIERIWLRIFLQDARLIAGETEYGFPDGAASAYTMEQLFTHALAPFFEASYPAHPHLMMPLGLDETNSLVANFFGGAGPSNDETQKLAREIARPLGLAVEHNGLLAPAPAESLLSLDLVKAASTGLTKTDEIVPIADVSGRLGSTPYGLTREAQDLVLAALVAQRQFEFVTSSDNRINYRSLDLQILWDDITGIALPLDEEYSTERLLFWAKTLTGEATLSSFEKPEDRLLIKNALADWLIKWKESRLVQLFDAVPDDALNTSAWRLAASVRKTFGTAADTIALVVESDASLDECMQVIAGLFADSEAEFQKKWADLAALQGFLGQVKLRNKVRAYLSVCDTTTDDEVEAARMDLLDALLGDAAFDRQDNALETLWPRFMELYAAHYAKKHAEVMDAFAAGRTLNEVLSTEAWAAFDGVSSVPSFDQRFAVAKQ
jgi:hypothetical protein